MPRITSIISFIGCSLAIVATPAIASAADEDLKPVAAALMSGDYVSAEALIARQGANDPAMLINLGNAYAGMGRRSDAQIAYRAAIKADPNMQLNMTDGAIRSAREVAAEGLRRLGVSHAAR